MRIRSFVGALAAAAVVAASTAAAQAQERFIIVASTTSTQASGLFEHLLPEFEKKTGIEVRVVAVGTGKAIRIAQDGDADILFVHHKPSEEKFVAEGYGIERKDVMYNDFVLVGPSSDPAGIKGMKDASDAVAKVADNEAVFVSRGDDSGTNKAELALWMEAGVKPEEASGQWYRSTGSGMGQTLNMAAATDGYTLADRGTWLSFQNRDNLEVLVEGDEALFNPYGVIVVNPERHPHVKKDDAQAFADWLTSSEGQSAIAGYKINGEQLFFPNAGTGS